MYRKQFASLDPLSNASSRSASRARTPQVDGEENGKLDFNFQSIEEVLASRLQSLQKMLEKRQDDLFDEARGKIEVQVQPDGNTDDFLEKHASKINQVRIQSGLTTINEIIGSLGASRTEVSSQSRELLLAQLYKLIVSKPLLQYNQEQITTEHMENYVTEEKEAELLKVFTAGDYRSASEFLLLFRSCIALIASDIDEFGGSVSTELLELLTKHITSPATASITNENKASIVTGLTAVLLIVHNGSLSFGIDDKILWLLEVAEGYVKSSLQITEDIKTGDREYSTFITDEDLDKRMLLESYSKAQAEANVAIAALHGCGTLLTLLPRGTFLNEYISDMVPKLVEILDNDINIEISKAAGRVIVLCYEIYTYSNDKEDNEDQNEGGDDEYNYNAPYYEQEQLITILNRLATTSSKRISKKDKKSTHSIFRDMLATVEAYTKYDTRIEILKRSPAGMEIIASLMDSTSIKLSKTRSLPINSWFLYLRLIHLKWCFSFGVHNQLIGNEGIRDVLREPKSEYQEKYGGRDVDVDEVDYEHYNSVRAVADDYKRTNAIRKARVNKLADELEGLELQS